MLGSIYVTVAVAFTLTIGILNFLNFTIPAIFMITGVIAWAVAAHWLPLGVDGGLAWPLAFIIGIVAAVLASLIVERFTFRYLRIRHGDATEHAIPLVSSLGFLIIFENLVLIAFGSEAQAFPEKFKSDFYIGEIIIGLPQLMSLAISLLVVAFLSWTLKTTNTGRALRAIAENPDTASLLGVDVRRIEMPKPGVINHFNPIYRRRFSKKLIQLIDDEGIELAKKGGLSSSRGSVSMKDSQELPSFFQPNLRLMRHTNASRHA